MGCMRVPGVPRHPASILPPSGWRYQHWTPALAQSYRLPPGPSEDNSPGRQAPVTESVCLPGASASAERRAPSAEYLWSGVCGWMVDFVQIVLFGVACGVGTDAVS